MNLKIGSSSEEVDRTSNSSWSVCSNSAHGAIGSISSSTSISNMTNSPPNQGMKLNKKNNASIHTQSNMISTK